MQEAKRMLLQANSHYFDRCNYFVEFKKLNRRDIELVCNIISDIAMDKDVVETIFNLSAGTLRKVVQMLHAVETLAKTRKLTKVKFADVKEILADPKLKKSRGN